MNSEKYISVILPLAVPKVYSYKVDEKLWPLIQFGIRVEVPLRNKLYSAIVIGETGPGDGLHKIRNIRSVIDTDPVITSQQYEFWRWIAHYYLSTIGEVMNVAMPAGLKLNSETKLIATGQDVYDEVLDDSEFIVAEALSIQGELSINQVQEILNRKTVYPLIKSLLDKNIIYIKEELKQKFESRKEDFISLTEELLDDKSLLKHAFDNVSRSERQTRALLSYVQLSKQDNWVAKKHIYKEADIDNSVIKALEKKNIIRVESREVSRIGTTKLTTDGDSSLNEHQQTALEDIRAQLNLKDHLLLFGVTGSGKTRLYIELIKEYIEKGMQVLYLLPEIALTTQIVDRLTHVFEGSIGVYHSKMTNNQRVELWNASLNGKSLILGARSSLFLPFSKMGLIIIDEEHDPSYKQSDPSPRYNARDAALYLSTLTGAKVVMGSATPSLSSFLNASTGKYGLVKLMERHGESVLPEMNIIDLREKYKKGLMFSLFSNELKDAIQGAIDKKEQVLLFQNRRGYAPTLQCTVCDFHAGCPNCDVSLTLHHIFDELRCHYCGYRHKVPKECPQCGHHELNKLGFGTEKIELEIQKQFPLARVARMDYDTAKTKAAYEKIISEFQAGEIDILVGTQMITKGLDFDNISIVGILNADRLLYFPDFHANERAFQLITQVAGRAGRRKKKGRVMIQTFTPLHPVIQETQQYNYRQFYRRELSERKRFYYPPFFRMIRITVRHKKYKHAEQAAQLMCDKLNSKIGNRVIGPSVPGISRIRGFYQQQVSIKMEKKKNVVNSIKALVIAIRDEILSINGLKSVRFSIDVDP